MPVMIWVWLGVGILLCSLELVVPSAFTEFAMGLSALGMAFLSLVIPQVSVQIALWMFLSLGLVLVARRYLLPRRGKREISFDAVEGETLTEILPGRTGRVLYEGNSWQALCQDPGMAITPNEKVLVVGRRGTTLIVVPERLLQS